MERKHYPTDLTDDQWEVVRPLLPEAKPGGRPRSVDVREVLNGVLYVVRGGVSCACCPATSPPGARSITSCGPTTDRSSFADS